MVGLSVCVLGAARRASAAEPPGEQVYARSCAACHGHDGTGAPRYRVGFRTRLPDFTDCKMATAESDLGWTAVVAQGGPARALNRRMPAFGEALSPDEIRQALGHLRSFCRHPGWPRGDLNLPRALVTEKAFPEDEVVVNVTTVTERPRAVTSSLIYEQRISARGQLEVIVPFGVQEQEAGGWRPGLGDIAFGGKYALVANRRAGSILSLAGEVALPTGDKVHGFGRGVVFFEPFLAFGQLLPSFSFVQLQVGAELSSRPGSAPHELYWRAAVGKSFMHKRFYRAFTPMLEVLGTRELEEGRKAQWDLMPELQVTLSRRKHVMASVGVRVPVESAERKPQVLLYLLWDWFEGGFLEGW